MRERDIDTLHDIDLYICDPNKNIECNKSHCYLYEGPCHLSCNQTYKANIFKALYIKVLCKIKKY